MSTLLPPCVVGPVYTFSTVVKVVSALHGAAVQLLQNGTPVAGTAVADSTGTAVIALGAASLSGGDTITAMQSLSGDQSQAGPGTTVLDVPGSLSPPIYLSMVHTCVDAVVLGGLQVGAVVEVTSGGKLLGSDVADATEIAVSLVRLKPLAVGAVLEARQTMSVGAQQLGSSRTPSLPAEQTPILERTLPAPQIVPPLYACDQSVLVTGIIDGMQVQVESSDGGGGLYQYGGNTLRVGTKALKEGAKVKATQYSQNCNFHSIVSSEVIVGKATTLPTPAILGPICTGLGQVVITDLVPGAEIHLYAGRDGSETLLGAATAAFTTQTFGVPDPLPPFSGGPTAYLRANQARCGVGSMTTVQTAVDQRTGNPQPPFISAPVLECARLVSISCDARGHGCALQILSDDPKTPILSGKIIITQDHTVVYLYRPLLAGETIAAVLTGCGAGPEARRSRRVESLPAVPTPDIEGPVRSWQRSVLVRNTLVGAQVYPFINDKYAAHAEATQHATRFPAAPFNPEDKITAQQCLCTRLSKLSEPAIVTFGHMKLTVSPVPIVRGATAQTVEVRAKDADYGNVVAGLVHLPGGVTLLTNAPFGWVFPVGQSAPATTVTAPDYVMENVKWNLVDPASLPPPPPPPPAALTLELANQVPSVILTKAEWDISHIASAGSGPIVVDTKTGFAVLSVLPKPAGAQESYFVGCTATFDYNGKSQTVQRLVALLMDFPFKATVRWEGKSEKAHFDFLAAYAQNADGQWYVSDFYIQLVDVKPI